jgi:hypothetical protein
MVVATVALFISLSGVSYGVATGFIDSREIKNNEIRSIDIRNNEIRTRDLRNNEVRGIDIRNSTIRGQDVALNTLTGDDLNEGTLGKVPSATSADTADSATTAGSVGGISLAKVAYAAEIGGTYVEFLNIGGLRLQARCLNAGTPAIEVRAYPGGDNSELMAEFPGSGSPATDDTDFDGETYILDTTVDSLARIEYAGSDGRVVSVSGFTRLESNGVRGSTNDCGFFGVAEAG